MEIINDYPPNYEELLKTFPLLETREVLITMGNKLYNPKEKNISDHQLIHEEQHGKRQLEHPEGLEGYIKQYVNDRKFRFEMEAEAYGIQCAYILKKYGLPKYKKALHHYGQELAGPMYGSLSSYDYAVYHIKKYANQTIDGQN